jgi:hypothetical protein
MEPSRPEKILIAMYALSKGKMTPCRYEDIVVRAFEMFQKDFQLRGYPKYPDSSDIHKPLYGPLKSKGLVRSANKTFALTEKGISLTANLMGAVSGAKSAGSEKKRLTRDMEQEIARIRQSEACKLYLLGKQDSILDTDFYGYLGVSVRTGKNDFIGRLNSVAEAVDTYAEIDPKPESKGLLELHKFLVIKFSALIQVKSGDNK